MNLRKKANLLLSTALSAAVCASFTLAFYSVPVEAQVGNTGNRAAAMQDGEGTEVDGNTVIEFKDPKFKAKILDLMHNFYKLIPQDVNEITAKTAAQIQHLDLKEQGITDLSGIEYFTGLEQLQLQENQIQDLKPLQNLTRLTELWLSKNKVTDLTPLKGLTALKTLLLTNNAVNDLQPLKGLQNLDQLVFENNKVKDLTPLKDLHNLTSLDVSGNSVVDLTPLAGLSKLKWLQANNCNLTKLPDFKNLTELYQLRLDNNKITDLTPLKAAAKLDYVSLSNNQVSDLTPLQDLKVLSGIWITNNHLTDLTPLEKLPKLQSLFSDYTRQKLSLSSEQKEVALPLKNSKDLSFRVQGGDAVGTVADGKFTLKHELPYKGVVKISFSNTGKVGQLELKKNKYTGTITINFDVKGPKKPETPQPGEQHHDANPQAAEQKTVTFMLGDANLPITINVEAGMTLDAQSLPTAPAKAGFTFKEWNTREDGQGQTFTTNTVVTEDMTLYAIYTENTAANTTVLQKNSRRTVSKTGETSCAASYLQLVEMAVAVLAAIGGGKRK